MLSRFDEIIGKRVVKGYKSQHFPAFHDNVIIAMSSGVDSSLSAALFAGHFPKARGVYIQSWGKSQSLTDPRLEPCYERDWKDVCRVAQHLNIPVDKMNFEKDYWLDVFEPMLENYNQGMTPNPDIGCNKFVKFGKLRQVLDQTYGARNYWLVTGHYSRILNSLNDDKPHLLRSFYTCKDQSYYLSQINADYLSQLIFPIGHLTKPEVRQLAAVAGLSTATKPDSQGICFVNNSQHGKFKHFLRHYLPDSVGNIITVDENEQKRIWGKHTGLWSYTIGQKVGISMPQGDPRYAGAWYVSEKLHDSNEIVIVKGRDNPALYKDVLYVSNIVPMDRNFRSLLEEGISNQNLFVQYRSLQEPVPLISCDFSHQLVIKLARPQRAIAPGQYCCFYLNNRVMGSGTISRVSS
ncbi:SLM3 (YDL033C) [Zygosaccharomyces parabailii]|nr:SLM3 (YDL033C) [Zygosaccharomyces parabailii]